MAISTDNKIVIGMAIRPGFCAWTLWQLLKNVWKTPNYRRPCRVYQQDLCARLYAARQDVDGFVGCWQACALVATGSKAMHTVALVPISTNSRLAGLAVGSGLLSPVFSPTTLSYLSNVPGTTASVSVTPTTSDPSASVKVNGTAVASGSTSGAISLGSGAVNTITVVVTAQDGVTSTTYTVIIDNTPFGVWKKTAFTDPADLCDPTVSGELACPAGDGITNLMKCALALEPMTCGTSASVSTSSVAR